MTADAGRPWKSSSVRRLYSKVPLQCLRKLITLVPREVALFEGDVRLNLDPKGRLSEMVPRAMLELVV